jgi:hypothetical protein
VTELPPQIRLTQMITGAVMTHAIQVVADLKIADLVSDGPKTPEELASTTGSDSDSLYRLLRMLAAESIFAEDGQGRFGLTPMAELLRSDSTSHLRDVALTIGSHARAYLELGHSIRTGQDAFTHVFGVPIFEHLAKNPEEARIFDGAMTGFHGPETAPMIESYDFSAFDTVVDIGGGNASVLLEILKANPKLNGVVFDLPHVADHASSVIVNSAYADRGSAEGGDFFSAVPEDADCYLMRHILHDWDDEKSIAILKNCREAMRPGGKVLVVESVIPPGNEPHPGKMLDVVMLAIPGGRERTADEYRTLFTAAGFKVTRIVPTASPVSVVEGVVA